MTKFFLIAAIITQCCIYELDAQQIQTTTYCNPVNLDYTYMIYNADKNISYRSGADPAVVKFRGQYYMFVTRSLGYWHSADLLNWTFITPEKWYFQGSNAPAAHNYKDEIDLQKPGKVYAIQVNYHDYKSDLYGRISNPYHHYTIEGSLDGQSWTNLVDRSV